MWEVVRANGKDIKSDRQKVLGGWIVRTFKSDQYGRIQEESFVSDPMHKWKLYREPLTVKKKVL